MRTNSLIESVYITDAVCIPGRLTAEQVATLLGLPNRDAVTILVQKKLLDPLGNPKPSAPKYFSTRLVAEKSRDSDWLNDATKVLSKYWKAKNAKRQSTT